MIKNLAKHLAKKKNRSWENSGYFISILVTIQTANVAIKNVQRNFHDRLLNVSLRNIRDCAHISVIFDRFR